MPDDIKKDYDKAKNFVSHLPFFLPFEKSMVYAGLENIMVEGPNIITANHPGVGKDIAGLLLAYDRQLYFTASDFLFSKDSMVAEAKKYLGPILSWALRSAVDKLSDYLPGKMEKFCMISIPIYSDGNTKKYVQSLRKSIDVSKDYLQQGRTVIFFQTRSNIIDGANHDGNGERRDLSKHHPYLPKFSNTVSKIAHELSEEGLHVPVTPVAFYNCEGINPFKKSKMNIGKPLYTDSADAVKHHKIYYDYKNGDGKYYSNIPAFTDLLEKSVAELLVEMGIPRT